MFFTNWKKDLFTIPNLLSLFRLTLIPVYMTIYLEGSHLLAGIILALSCLTDLLDGWVDLLVLVDLAVLSLAVLGYVQAYFGAQNTLKKLHQPKWSSHSAIVIKNIQ